MQKGQDVIIRAGLDQPDFVRMVVEECYALGARYVRVEWSYQPVSKVTYKKASLKTLSTVEDWEVAKIKHRVDTLPVMIYLESEDPDGMAGINHEEYDLSSEELFQIVRTAKAFCNENDMEMDFTSPGLIPSDELEALGMNVPSCGAALSNMAIAPDGRVIPCQSWLGEGAEPGDILTHDFSDIWNSKKCVSLRAMSDDEALCCPFREEA